MKKKEIGAEDLEWFELIVMAIPFLGLGWGLTSMAIKLRNKRNVLEKK